MANYIQHRFFCINCGKEGIPVYRQASRFHKKFHRKKLYCPWCKMEINHVECFTDEDVKKFQEDFMNGVYLNEAKESLSYGRPSGLR